MSRLEWDKTGERFYETGVDHGVFYKVESGVYSGGVAWNGLTTVTESPSGAEANPKYADNIKYINLISTEEFGATIEAYTYPPEFAECDGTATVATGVSIGQQNRKTFGLCYRTVVGNDEDGSDYGYKLHLIYGCVASPSQKAYTTINDSPDAISFSWEVKTTPVNVPGYKPTASLVIDSTTIDSTKLTQIENILYGTNADADAETEGTEPRMPLPEEIIKIINGTNTTSATTNNPSATGDGNTSATGDGE